MFIFNIYSGERQVLQDQKWGLSDERRALVLVTWHLLPSHYSQTRVGGKKITTHRFVFLKMRSRCRYASSAGTYCFRCLPTPRASQSMSVLLVCAVMAHLEYNRHSWTDIARLVCLCSLVCCFLFSSFSFLPPILICLSISCMSHRSVCSGSLNGPIVWRLR